MGIVTKSAAIYGHKVLCHWSLQTVSISYIVEAEHRHVEKREGQASVSNWVSHVCQPSIKAIFYATPGALQERERVAAGGTFV